MTNRPGISKYFIAIVPPSPIFEQVWQWKEYFKIKFNSKASLNSPPHITLHMPFEWKASKEDFLLKSLTEFSTQCSPFEIALQNFGCFPPRVIFIHVVENPELVQLQLALTHFCKAEFNLFNANRLDLPYHPHLTVAFRDLKKSVFPLAWAQVEHADFKQRFTCNSLALLKHNGKQWEVRSTFGFS